MLEIIPYDRRAAVTYAHRWAYQRNPLFYNYDELGGDCTNFASQCLYAGTGVMNFTPTYGWYYRDPNDKAPAWTGVPYFFDFMTRREESSGPFGLEASMSMLLPGDFVQLQFSGERYAHTPIIVAIREPVGLDTILVAAHSDDADFRPLSTYNFQHIRFIHFRLGLDKAVCARSRAQEDIAKDRYPVVFVRKWSSNKSCCSIFL